MQTRKVLVLGASGYLGTQLFHAFQNEPGTKAIGTCYSSRLHPHCVPLDVTDERHVQTVLREVDPDVVIWSLMSKEDEQHMVAAGLPLVLRQLSEYAKFIFFSTDGIFSRGEGGYTETDEGTPLNPANPLAGYTGAKIWGEAFLRLERPQSLIVRVGPIYGRTHAGRWDHRTAALLDGLRSGDEITRAGNLYKTFVHVEDVASAIFELAGSSWTGTLHLGPEQKESYASFARATATRFGFDPALIRETILSTEEASLRGIPLDTSLSTRLAHRLLRTRFRTIRDHS